MDIIFNWNKLYEIIVISRAKLTIYFSVFSWTVEIESLILKPYVAHGSSLFAFV